MIRMAVPSRLAQRAYPDASHSGTLFFYGRLRRELAGAERVLNVGAGPGDEPGTDTFSTRDLRGHGAHICGCDPDPAVLNNAQLDEARVMDSDSRIPYEDKSFDVVYADYVLEHVERPEAFLAEVYRVLKPGGAFHFRTPNLHHYVSIAARLLPHAVHTRIANRARNLPEGAREPYRTFHRMNTRRALRALAILVGFSRVELVMFEGEPSYLMFNSAAFLLGVVYERLVNGLGFLGGVRANVMGRMLK